MCSFTTLLSVFMGQTPHNVYAIPGSNHVIMPESSKDPVRQHNYVDTVVKNKSGTHPRTILNASDHISSQSQHKKRKLSYDIMREPFCDKTGEFSALPYPSRMLQVKQHQQSALFAILRQSEAYFILQREGASREASNQMKPGTFSQNGFLNFSQGF